MNNNVIDKVYLALELTRLYIEQCHKDGKTQFKKEGVFDAFNFYVTHLTGIENLSDYNKMEQELEEITEKYNDLRENMETIIEEKAAYKKDVLKHILDNAKGDMEHYVYESLIKLVK